MRRSKGTKDRLLWNALENIRMTLCEVFWQRENCRSCQIFIQACFWCLPETASKHWPRSWDLTEGDIIGAEFWCICNICCKFSAVSAEVGGPKAPIPTNHSRLRRKAVEVPAWKRESFNMTVLVLFILKITISGSFGFRIRCFGGEKASHCFRWKSSRWDGRSRDRGGWRHGNVRLENYWHSTWITIQRVKQYETLFGLHLLVCCVFKYLSFWLFVFMTFVFLNFRLFTSSSFHLFVFWTFCLLNFLSFQLFVFSTSDVKI